MTHWEEDRCHEKVQIIQNGEGAQIRNRPTQLVVIEAQPCQFGEVAQFGWNRPTQLIGVKHQGLQVGEVAQFGRDRPTQLILMET